jgi:hypothetical protein
MIAAQIVQPRLQVREEGRASLTDGGCSLVDARLGGFEVGVVLQRKGDGLFQVQWRWQGFWLGQDGLLEQGKKLTEYCSKELQATAHGQTAPYPLLC